MLADQYISDIRALTRIFGHLPDALFPVFLENPRFPTAVKGLAAAGSKRPLKEVMDKGGLDTRNTESREFF